jgi:hypothetical protein
MVYSVNDFTTVDIHKNQLSVWPGGVFSEAPALTLLNRLDELTLYQIKDTFHSLF